MRRESGGESHGGVGPSANVYSVALPSEQTALIVLRKVLHGGHHGACAGPTHHPLSSQTPWDHQSGEGAAQESHIDCTALTRCFCTRKPVVSGERRAGGQREVVLGLGLLLPGLVSTSLLPVLESDSVSGSRIFGSLHREAGGFGFLVCWAWRREGCVDVYIYEYVCTFYTFMSSSSVCLHACAFEFVHV